MTAAVGARPGASLPDDAPTRPIADLLAADVHPVATGDTAPIPVARPVPPAEYRAEHRAEHRAHPDSPVGRLTRDLAADPYLTHPLRRLEQRLGRPLLDLATCTDLELHAIAEQLLIEKHARATRWLGLH